MDLFQGGRSLRLAKNERCYHIACAVWAQVKVVRKHHGYIGGSIGFRVAKGITLRLGKAVPCISENEELVDISTGQLYVTNKKLVFIGERKSTNINLDRIATYEMYSDAIEIKKISGKPDVFKLDTQDIEFIDALFQVIN